MHILILDTETTGLDPKKDHAIEVACCVFDLDHASPVEWYSSLIRGDRNEAEHVNRIPVEILKNATRPEEVWRRVEIMACDTMCVVAHRAEFDRAFCPSIHERWVCSKFEIEWPMSQSGSDLAHLALAHGVPVVSAHRALADVDTLVRTFQAVARVNGRGFLDLMIERAMRPRCEIVSLAPFELKDTVKNAGFAWDPKRGSRGQWYRSVAIEDVESFRASLPFKTFALNFTEVKP